MHLVTLIPTYLKNEIPATEVGDGSWQPRSPPNEAEEEGAFIVVEFFHDFPEPSYEASRAINSFVGGHGLEQV